ncbi:hypothetical protein CR51_25205 [Caballeronia megalochromosomata]|jgi:hypothetical protein|nr:hypothetical protein CR51_25205 [Caballeronia megalochromosomata]
MHYAIVDGDPLSSGETSRVYATKGGGTIEGPDGIDRDVAYLGDKAWCCACQSEGVIVKAANVPDSMRGTDETVGGRAQAVSGDKVKCSCPQPPTVVARYGRHWQIE